MSRCVSRVIRSPDDPPLIDAAKNAFNLALQPQPGNADTRYCVVRNGVYEQHVHPIKDRGLYVRAKELVIVDGDVWCQSYSDEWRRYLADHTWSLATTVRPYENWEQTRSQAVPAIGSNWKHRNGTPYHVLLIANEPDDERYPLTVVYQGPNGKVWARRADDWHRSMTEIKPA